MTLSLSLSLRLGRSDDEDPADADEPQALHRSRHRLRPGEITDTIPPIADGGVFFL